MKNLRDLIKLNDEQKEILNRMSEVYHEAQRAGIAFALNEDAFIVAFNSREIEDCDQGQEENDEYEFADANEMKELFPVLGYSELYLKRK